MPTPPAIPFGEHPVGALPWHAMLVHFPVAMAVLGPLLLVGLWLACGSGPQGKRAAILLLFWQLALVVVSYGALLTGQHDEESVSRLIGHKTVHQHEEAGEWVLFASIGCLVLAVATAKRPQRLTWVLLLAGQLFLLATGVRAGHLGGELVYKHGAAGASGPPQ